MLERVLVALLAGGHVLLEGVPGLAKTLTVKTVADVLGGTFSASSSRPTSSRRDLVGTRVLRPGRRSSRPSSARCSRTSCSPTRSTARPRRCSPRCSRSCRSARSRSATRTHPVPAPFIVLATQNPIESEGTYPLPEAQVDRFMFKLVVDYPTDREEAAVVARSLGGPDRGRAASCRCSTLETPPARVAGGLRRPPGRRVRRRARRPRRGARARTSSSARSPRGSINLVHAARALALLRGRSYALPVDVRDLARDVLRHRIVLTYEALADGVTPDALLDRGARGRRRCRTSSSRAPKARR